MQTYSERLPTASLADLVSCVWVQQVSPDGPAYEHRTVPNGCIEVVFVKGAPAGSVIGPRRAPVVERLAPGSTVVGVRFRPGVPAAVLGAAAPELVDRDVELDAVWGQSAAATAERIALAATPDDAARVLEQEIAARCAAAGDVDPLVAGTVRRLQPWHRGGVGDIASELFISPRQLRRRCIAAFGFGPKTLHRILRFQGFLALAPAAGRHELGLSRLAATTGYFDQAHLTRECLALSGLTPGAFLTELRSSCGANHDHAASLAGVGRALAMTQVAPLSSDSSKSRPRARD